MASDRPKRKAIPVRIKLAATLIFSGMRPDVAEWFSKGMLKDEVRTGMLLTLLASLGLPDDAEFDHDPALGLRPVNAAGDDFDPPQLDPRHIVPRSPAAHYAKTNGHRPGEKLVTTASSDKGRIAKAERLEASRYIPGFKPTDPLPPDVTVAFDTADRASRTGKVHSRALWPKGRKIQSRGFDKRKRGDG